MSEDPRLTIPVSDEAVLPQRLDQFLTAELNLVHENFTRSRVQKLIADGLVTVDQKPAKPGIKLKGGETISVVIPEDVPLQVDAEDIPLDIKFEDEHLVVVNKATGMVTHPGAGVHNGTLVNALLFHCGHSLSGISGVLRPGIVHRLDKDTSGLLVVAKNDLAHQSLAQQIQMRSAKRSYLALLEGTLEQPSGLVDKPIGRHPVDRKKMSISDSGRPAQTQYEVLRQLHKFTLIKAHLKTGRTHQIRVHMASLNCPVVGDLVYNNKTTGTISARKRLGLSGQALHAAYLSFTHPATGQLLEFEAELPKDFRSLLTSLS